MKKGILKRVLIAVGGVLVLLLGTAGGRAYYKLNDGPALACAGIVNTRIVDRNGEKVDTNKLSKAVKWAKFLAEAEERSNKNV